MKRISVTVTDAYAYCLRQKAVTSAESPQPGDRYQKTLRHGLRMFLIKDRSKDILDLDDKSFAEWLRDAPTAVPAAGDEEGR